MYKYSFQTQYIGGGWEDSPLLCKSLWVPRKALYKCKKLFIIIIIICFCNMLSREKQTELKPNRKKGKTWLSWKAAVWNDLHKPPLSSGKAKEKFVCLPFQCAIAQHSLFFHLSPPYSETIVSQEMNAIFLYGALTEAKGKSRLDSGDSFPLNCR